MANANEQAHELIECSIKRSTYHTQRYDTQHYLERCPYRLSRSQAQAPLIALCITGQFKGEGAQSTYLRGAQSRLAVFQCFLQRRHSW